MHVVLRPKDEELADLMKKICENPVAAGEGESEVFTVVRQPCFKVIIPTKAVPRILALMDLGKELGIPTSICGADGAVFQEIVASFGGFIGNGCEVTYQGTVKIFGEPRGIPISIEIRGGEYDIHLAYS